MKFAIVTNGIVENIVKGELNFLENSFPNSLVIESDLASIGDAYENGYFTSPAVEITPKKLSKLEFMDLLGFNTLVAIETAAETKPTVRVLKEYMNASSHVDMGSDYPQALLGVLVKEGVITYERMVQILAS